MSFASPGITLVSLGIMLLASGCHSKSDSPAPAPLPPSAERGRTIYQTQCIACHNSDPRKPGSIGPDIFGSSQELLQARILKGSYPPGYKPKRSSHSMAPLPHLKNEIDSIHAFLNEKAQ